MQTLPDTLAPLHADMREWRRDIHAHPELGFQESRNVAPVYTAVLSVTQIHAGDAYNVIPQTARLGGTVRAFSREGVRTSAARNPHPNPLPSLGAGEARIQVPQKVR